MHLCLESNHHDEQDLEAFASATRGDLEQADSRASLALRRGWYRRVKEKSARILSAQPDPIGPDLSDLLAADGFFDEPGDTGAIRLRSYGTELAEVRAIARSLKARLLSGAEPRNCAVAFPALDRYLPLVRDTFAAYGIPYVVEKGAALAISPPVSAARQVLRLAARGGDRDDLRNLFATNWLCFEAKVEAHRIDDLVAMAFPGKGTTTRLDQDALKNALKESIRHRPIHRAKIERLHRYLLESGSVYGPPSDWLAPMLSKRRAQLHSALRRVPAAERAQLLQQRWAAIAEDVRDIHALNEFWNRVERLRLCKDITEAAGALQTLLVELQLTPAEAEKTEEQDELFETASKQNANALKCFAKVLDDIGRDAAICEQFGPTAPKADSSISQLHEILEQIVGDTYYRTASTTEGVSITGLRDLRGVDIPWLWIGGAVESEFPRSPRASFLLPPSAASRIESREETIEDRALFFSLLRNFEHGDARLEGFLCVSWPKTVGGKDVPPSALVQDLLSLRVRPANLASHEAVAEKEGTLGAHWQALQEAEEQALPTLLCEQELLTAPNVVQLSEALLSDDICRQLESHRRLNRERASLQSFGAWDGVVGLGTAHRPESLRWLWTRLTGQRTPSSIRFSATALESWARCPMRYFLQRVLGAEEPEPWSADVGPPEQGILVHRILERFFAERIKLAAQGRLERAGLSGASTQEAAQAKLRLRELTFEAADEVLGTEGSPYRDELVRQLTAGLDPTDPDNGNFAGRLSLFVDEEVQDFLGLDPIATEHSFEAFSPGAVANKLDKAGRQGSGAIEILVSGTIDRVDSPRAGQRGLAGTSHAVYDYKTGKVGPLKSIDLGLNMQPVVYAAAAAPDALETTVSGYRRVPAQVESGRQRMAGSPRALDALKAALPSFGKQSFKIDPDLWPMLLRRIEWYGQLIATGFFPTTLAGSKVAGCEACDYRRVCRHDSLRAAQIDPQQESLSSFLPRPQSATKLLALLPQSLQEDSKERE